MATYWQANAHLVQYLEQDKMILRRDFQTVPPHVEYSLTPFGKTASDKLYELVYWLETTLPEIEKDR
ncbi:winged helix-turn-helix transcriptional regulator [Ursidibacter sp. B-7004-1]